MSNTYGSRHLGCFHSGPEIDFASFPSLSLLSNGICFNSASDSRFSRTRLFAAPQITSASWMGCDSSDFKPTCKGVKGLFPARTRTSCRTILSVDKGLKSASQ